MFKKYTAIFRLSFVLALKNYKALIGLSIFLVTCLIIFAHLWKITALGRNIVNFDPRQLLWYIAFNEWVLISIPDTQEDMELDLRSGRLAYLLPRPISYPAAVFAEAFGSLCVNLLILGLVAFLFTWAQVGILPFHPIGFIATLGFGLIAGIIGIMCRMIIGLSAFWLHTVEPLFWIWEKLLFMLGGLMLPLTTYPQWMQRIAHFTPFPTILGERSALAFHFSLQSIVPLAFSLISWSILSCILLLWLYRKGLRVLNVEGG